MVDLCAFHHISLSRAVGAIHIGLCNRAALKDDKDARIMSAYMALRNMKGEAPSIGASLVLCAIVWGETVLF